MSSVNLTNTNISSLAFAKPTSLTVLEPIIHIRSTVEPMLTHRALTSASLQTSSMQTAEKLFALARFRTVRDVCEKPNAGLDCVDAMSRLSQSANPQQAGNATEYIQLYAHKFAGIYQQALQSVDELKQTLDVLKPEETKPLPDQCQSSRCSADGVYMPLTECVKRITSIKPSSTDNLCTFVNECAEDVKLRFGNKEVIVNKGQNASCFKSGVYYEDAFFTKQGGNPAEMIARAVVKTAYSTLACNLDGNYRPDETLVARVSEAQTTSSVKPTAKDSPVLAKVKQACRSVASLNCAKNVVKIYQKNQDSEEIQGFIHRHYETLNRALEAEAKRLEDELENIENAYLAPSVDVTKSQCDQSQSAFSVGCIESVARLVKTKDPQVAMQAKAFIANNREKFVNGCSSSMEQIQFVRNSILSCQAVKTDSLFGVDAALGLRVKKLQQDCEEITLECASNSAKLIEASHAHLSVCQFAQQNKHQIIRVLDRTTRHLEQFKEENNALFFPPKPLGKCESSRPETALQDCIELRFDCDQSGDNTCEYKNLCPEDLLLTQHWQSKKIRSGEKAACFEIGTYTQSNERGEKREYKDFGILVCSEKEGEEDDPRHHDKVFVSKVNDQQR